MPLSPDTLLSITIGATITRHRYDADCAPAIEGIRGLAGDRVDLLAHEVGLWVGFFQGDPHIGRMIDALRGMTDLHMADAIALGEERRGAGRHSTRGFTEPGTRAVIK